MNFIAILLKILDLVDVGSSAYDQIVALKAKLEAFKAEGRDPTPDEWSALFDSIDAESAALDAADKRLGG